MSQLHAANLPAARPRGAVCCTSPRLGRARGSGVLVRLVPAGLDRPGRGLVATSILVPLCVRSGRLHDSRCVVDGCVHGVDLHGFVTDVRDVVPRACWHEDRPAVLDLLVELALVLGGPICTRPRPPSSRRNWSVSGCASRPMSSPGGIDMSVSWRYRPVQATVRYVVFASVADSRSKDSGSGPSRRGSHPHTPRPQVTAKRVATPLGVRTSVHDRRHRVT